MTKCEKNIMVKYINYVLSYFYFIYLVLYSLINNSTVFTLIVINVKSVIFVDS